MSTALIARQVAGRGYGRRRSLSRARHVRAVLHASFSVTRVLVTKRRKMKSSTPTNRATAVIGDPWSAETQVGSTVDEAAAQDMDIPADIVARCKGLS
jgi:hypothetical protein